MNNIFILTKYTFKEALSRKIFLTFFGIITFVLLLLGVVFYAVDLTAVIPPEAAKLEGGTIKDGIFYALRIITINPLFGGGLFLSIFSAASFIPKMLEKGSVEIILSKPVSRAQIIMGKFFGVTAVVFVNIAYFITVFYLMIGLKFGIWELNFLTTIFTITLAFAVLYSFIILTGIITNTSLPALMLSYLIFIILSPLLYGRESFEFLTNMGIIDSLADILYYLTPRTAELGEITMLISGGAEIESLSAVYHSLIFIILTLGLSIFIFNKKDY